MVRDDSPDISDKSVARGIKKIDTLKRENNSSDSCTGEVGFIFIAMKFGTKKKPRFPRIDSLEI